jgi:hypothetical protein
MFEWKVTFHAQSRFRHISGLSSREHCGNHRFRSDARRKIGYQGEQNGLSESGINLELKLSFRPGALSNPLRVYCGGAAVVCA